MLPPPLLFLPFKPLRLWRVPQVPEGLTEELWPCKVEALWESCEGERLIDCRWYYSPEETRTGRLANPERLEFPGQWEHPCTPAASEALSDRAKARGSEGSSR